MHVNVLTLLLPSVVLFDVVSATVKTSDVPVDLAKCFGIYKKKTTLRKTVPSSIQSMCQNLYMWKNAKELNVLRGAKPQAVNYINSLLANTKQEIVHHRITRKKRQANPLTNRPKIKLRQRKELRMMSDDEIKLFFDAVNSAKQNVSIEPNKYDALAEFHTGITAVSAHGGCNFFGWHRMYLLMFENALREEGPRFKDVTIPYWDSTLDTKMEDPLQSALWTDRLLGSCGGEAKGGLMAQGWDSSTGVIMRNCAGDGPLVSEEMIRNVTRHTRMQAICGIESEIDDDWEYHHNGVHRWIDGQMAILPSAVFDPVFWLHHAFVDLVWELFRNNQKKAKVDVESDYPPSPTTMGAEELHLPNAELGFANLTVLDGLSEMFTSEWYTYADRPTCKGPKKGCLSKYLKCVPAVDQTERAAGKFECVARTLKEVEEYEQELNKPKPKPCVPVKQNKPTTATPTVHVTEAPKTNTTVKSHVVREIKPVQNTYCMNGRSDISQWVYIPIKLILRRPPDYVNYGSYPVRRGKIEKAQGDIYSPSAYNNVYRHLRKPEVQAKYDNCEEPDSPTNTIYVKSMGLNYEGIYKEYALMDKRLAVTIATAYVAVRKPLSVHDVSVSMITAQDSCGRVCKPICKVEGTEIFRPCSGAVKVTGGLPLQFGNSFGDAVLKVWDFDQDASCPQLTTNSMIVSFYCDYSTEWIWPSIDPPPKSLAKPATPLPPVEKTTVTAGCSLGWGCVVNKPCTQLTSCTAGEVVECFKSCHMYAGCFRGQYKLYRCRRGERYLRGQGCVSSRGNPCNYSTSGLNRWRNNMTQQMRRRRRSL